MIQSISVNGEVHQIDYTTLANKPGDEFFLPSVTENDAGKVLTVNSEGEWQPESLGLLPSGDSSGDEGKILIYDGYSWVFSDFTMPDLQRQINGLATQLSQLQERVAAIASGSSSTQVTVTNDKVALNGSGFSVSGEKLSIDDTTANVTGEKLSITEEV